ncbi:hypothetical protein ICN11_01630 [Polynucleobacter sp. 78F-HAINBA]|uniref:hypothetical protein n=1 Tax=Polynucleobacter sp. 78F-HAINBA TaxID=2689099 RepID=UPI001C0B2024|nr:hypothetical protein [Polynucleobacter sp. 78F-HAINBA]MBU3590721.1 hypothetical protein [Polynucleobacter sp. 78F-HAINBA]
MTNIKSTSRIINEMHQTIRGLDRCEVPTVILTKNFGKFIWGARNKTKHCKSTDEAKKG